MAWMCEQSSGVKNFDNFQACGVAEAKTEMEARQLAYESAKSEFDNICQSSNKCKENQVLVEPGRTACSKEGDNFKCYRLIIFTLTDEKKKSINEEDLDNLIEEKKKNLERLREELYKSYELKQLDEQSKIYKKIEKEEIELTEIVTSNEEKSPPKFFVSLTFDGLQRKYQGQSTAIVAGGYSAEYRFFQPVGVYASHLYTSTGDFKVDSKKYEANITSFKLGIPWYFSGNHYKGSEFYIRPEYIHETDKITEPTTNTNQKSSRNGQGLTIGVAYQEPFDHVNLGVTFDIGVEHFNDKGIFDNKTGGKASFGLRFGF